MEKGIRYFCLLTVVHIVMSIMLLIPIGWSGYMGSNISAFEVRRDSALKDASKFGVPSASSRAYVYKILGMLWHEDDPDMASCLLVEALIAQERGVFTSASLYWSMPALVRIYFLFNSQTGIKSQLLETKAEEKLLNAFWHFLNKDGEGTFTSDNDPWRFAGSENHDMLRRSTSFLIAQILKDKPDYSQRNLAWGQSIEKFYKHGVQYFNMHLTEKATRGLFIEGAGIYHGVTLEGIYNIMDFSDKHVLQVKAEMFLDIYWIDHAIESVNGLRGGAKARIYSYWRDTVETTPYMLAAFYFSPDVARNIAIRPMPPGFVPMLTSDYRPPEIAYRLVSEPEYRGEFEYLTRRPGVSEQFKAYAWENVAGMRMGVFFVDSQKSVLRYSYITPYYIMGSFIHNLEHTLTRMTSENRWEGIIFASDNNARLYAYIDVEESVLNAFSTTQKGPIMLTQLRPHIRGEVKVSFPHELEKYEFNPEEGWFIGDLDESTYFGIMTVNSKLNFDRGMLVPKDSHSPLIIRAGNINSYSSLEEFKISFLSDLIDYSNRVLTYNTPYGEIRTNFIQRFLDGEAWNYEPEYVFYSPFMKLKWGSTEVVILYEESEIVYDFCKAERSAEIKRIQ